MGSSGSRTPHTPRPRLTLLPPSDGVVSPKWRRVQLSDLPEGVTALSVPGVGTSWYRRGITYWINRLVTFAMFVTLAVVYVLLYKMILWDDPNTTHFGAMWWGVLIFGVVTTAEGYRVALPGRRLLWKVLRTNPGRLVSAVLAVPFFTYALSVAFLAPGIALSRAVQSLSPTTPDERIARADLDAQLRAHPHHHPGKRR